MVPARIEQFWNGAGTCGAVGHEATVPERTVRGAHVARPSMLRPVAENPSHREHEPISNFEILGPRRFSLPSIHGVPCGFPGPYRDTGTGI